MAATVTAAARARRRPGARPVHGATVLATVVGGLTGLAGIVHVAHATTHLRPTAALGIGFFVVGWVQLVLAGAVLARGGTRVLLATAAIDVFAIGAWAHSRTVGLPLVGVVEPVGAADGFTAAVAAVAAIAAVRLAAPREVEWQVAGTIARAVAWSAGSVLVTATTAALLTGAHLHGSAHHTPGTDSAVAPGHDIFGHSLDGSHEHDLFPLLDD